MAIHVERSEYDPQLGFQYYICFNPNMRFDEDEVATRVPVETAISLSEGGEISDLTFELPKFCRSDQAVYFIRMQESARYIEPRVFVDFPGRDGDTVVPASGHLELDRLGRIIGMDITFAPMDSTTA